MILDSIENIGLYNNLSENIQKAIQHFLYNDFTNLPAGKVEVDGDNIFALVNRYSTKPASDCKLESHKKYIDLQIMLSGSEKIGFTLLKDQIPSEAYSEEKEVMFYKEDYEPFTFSDGMFAIFFPHDIHMPGMINERSEEVLKVVYKIKMGK